MEKYKPDKFINLKNIDSLRSVLRESVHELRKIGSTSESLHVNRYDRISLINCVLRAMGHCCFKVEQNPSDVEAIYGVNIIVVQDMPKGKMILMSREWYTYLDTRFIKKIGVQNEKNQTGFM